MSRLIDADKLCLHLNDIALGVAPNEWEQEAVKKERQVMYDTITSIMDIVEKQPTAFDKDKVIEELRENWFLGGWSVEHQGKSGTYYTDEEGKVVELHEAIKIVKRGGMS